MTPNTKGYLLRVSANKAYILVNNLPSRAPKLEVWIAILFQIYSSWAQKSFSLSSNLTLQSENGLSWLLKVWDSVGIEQQNYLNYTKNSLWMVDKEQTFSLTFLCDNISASYCNVIKFQRNKYCQIYCSGSMLSAVVQCLQVKVCRNWVTLTKTWGRKICW